MPPLRTLLFVPGARESMLEKAAGLDVDAVILDLEDSVPPAEKERARLLVRGAIADVAADGREAWVRVNSTYTGLAKDDCRAVVVPDLTGVLLPKADSAEIIRFTEALLRDAEALNGVESGKTRIIAGIESAASLLHIEAIGGASDRLIALAFGSEDFTAEMQVERTPGGAELAFARGLIGIAARAAGLQAIDSVYPYLHDSEGLIRDAEEAKRLGFQGKLLIHPEQIAPVAHVFRPTDARLSEARQIVEAYAEAARRGEGAVQVNGQMIDAPVFKRAQRLLDETRESAVPEIGWKRTEQRAISDR